MSDQPQRHPGQVNLTPEGGPLDEGVPVSAPGAGQVRLTPEAGPLDQAGPLTPPTLRDHMNGPILGLDDAPASGAAANAMSGRADQHSPHAASPPSPGTGPAAPTATTTAPEEIAAPQPFTGRTARDDEELKKWPPYSGKPVSEVRWDALRFAAPVVSQAEKLAIRAIDLSGKGLSGLAHVLEERRIKRHAQDEADRGQSG